MTLRKRYAEGFLQYAEETIGFNKGLEELKGMKNVFKDNPDFKKFLENPAINYTEKCQLIDNALSKEFSDEVREFLKILLKNGRIDAFHDIAEYSRIKYSHGEEIEAVLNTSYALDTGLIRSIKEKVEEKLKKKLHLFINLDPSLLGGVRVTVGNTIFDGSVKNRLEDIRKKLIAAKAG